MLIAAGLPLALKRVVLVQQQQQQQDRQQLRWESSQERHPRPTLDQEDCEHVPHQGRMQARGHDQRKPLRHMASGATVAALEQRGVAAMEWHGMMLNLYKVLQEEADWLPDWMADEPCSANYVIMT